MTGTPESAGNPATFGPAPGGPTSRVARPGARREYLTALTALAGGGALALLVAQAGWVTATPAGLSYATVLTGSQLSSAIVACALVAIAGSVGVIASRGLGRRLVGAVLAVVGLVLVAGPVRVLLDPSGAARDPLARLAGAGAVPRSASVAWWWCLVAVLGGAAVAAGAVLTVLRGKRWPVMGARFEAPSAPGRPVTVTDAWARLDRGEDPTVDAPHGPARVPDGESERERDPRGAPEPEGDRGQDATADQPVDPRAESARDPGAAPPSDDLQQ